MTKISIEPKLVFNLGGYIVESVAGLSYRDVVVGNPGDETIKVDAPVYSEQDLKAYEDAGLICEPMKEGDSLAATLEKVKKKVAGK